MGKKMAGTNEFAFFRCRSICTGGGPESGRKNSKKCLPAGTGTKIYFSSFVSSECFCWRAKKNSQNPLGFVNITDFCKFSFSQSKNHSQLGDEN